MNEARKNDETFRSLFFFLTIPLQNFTDFTYESDMDFT
jgi:hypothetical protein